MCSYFIFLSASIFIMMSAICLNAKLMFRRVEIQYISVNRKLPSEFYAIKLTASQYSPEFIFSICLVFSKVSAFVNVIPFHAPSPCPSPQRGEGQLRVSLSRGKYVRLLLSQAEACGYHFFNLAHSLRRQIQIEFFTPLMTAIFALKMYCCFPF